MEVRIRVVLVEPEKEGNIGGVARAMKNFGLTQLYLVNPKVTVGVEARAYASHGVEVLEKAKIVGSLDEALEGVDCVVGTTAKISRSPSNLRRITIFPEELAKRLTEAPRGTVALLFGRESIGLLNKELERCDVLVTIPSNPKYPVLNVVTAAAVVFYELYKAFKAKGKVSYAKPADRKVVEAALKHFEGLMVASGIHGAKLDLTMKALKNLMGRGFLAKREATLLAGAFRKALLRVSS
ncbi:MAG: hypothetical protein DRJ98_01635 [Thermoprotei archaeon]|nr:MAG: hypothetical protein DRJ98_01635 [Thermoprotei archaeon]